LTRRDAGAGAGPSSSALWSSAAGPLFMLAAEEAASGDDVGYSKASYFTTLGLFVISFPGLYSLVKRSAKSKARPASRSRAGAPAAWRNPRALRPSPFCSRAPPRAD
jgi:hypothetical protein